MSSDTKERLLDAAEQLFAERGFAATSLRDLTAVAEANLASVNYHFGTKEALLAEVLGRRLAPVNSRRLALLDEVEAGSTEGPRLERVLWAYLAPPFHSMRHWGEAGRRFTRLIGRIMSDPARSSSEALVAQFTTVRARFHAAFARALPALSGDEVERRMHYVIGTMVHTFLWCENISCLCPGAEDDPDAVLNSLIGFAAAGMSAAETPHTPPALPLSMEVSS